MQTSRPSASRNAWLCGVISILAHGVIVVILFGAGENHREEPLENSTLTPLGNLMKSSLSHGENTPNPAPSDDLQVALYNWPHKPPKQKNRAKGRTNLPQLTSKRRSTVVNPTPPSPRKDAGAPTQQEERDAWVDTVTMASPTSVDTSSNDAGTEPGLRFNDAPSDPATRVVNLFPSRYLVTVLIRFQRLQGSEWTKHIEAILAPMPDYKTLMRGNTQSLAEKFHSVLISTTNPRRLEETTLIGHTRADVRQTQNFVDKHHPITWKRVRGGILGSAITNTDSRIFLIPYPRWVLWTRASWLTNAVLPPGRSNPATSTPERTAEVDPILHWLSQLRSHEEAGGKHDAPLVVVLKNLNPTWSLPIVGRFVAPTVTSNVIVQTHDRFSLGGILGFRSSHHAQQFLEDISRIRNTLQKSTLLAKTALGPLFSLANNLTLTRDKNRIAYRIFLSKNQMRSVLVQISQWSCEYFRSC